LIDSEGHKVLPENENAYQFERFYFDMMPLARHGIVVETKREDEFNPVKNASKAGPGSSPTEDSPTAVQAAMMKLHADWLTAAGLSVADAEIGALFALNKDDVRSRFQGDGKIKIEGQIFLT
jgi:UDP-N-acetylglucosamine/UDP-N-acetylgalactosamine diphosphorylase